MISLFSLYICANVRVVAAVRDNINARQELQRHAMSLEDRWAKALTWPNNAPNEMEKSRIEVLVEREHERLRGKMEWVDEVRECVKSSHDQHF